MKHGHRSNGKMIPEYQAWVGMRYRCNNSNHPHFKNWGGRGIGYCDRWKLFENFFEDMGPKPDPKLTLERRNNDKGYFPENCYWATFTEQNNNSRPISCGPCKQRVFIAMNGQGTMITSNNQHEFAREYGLSAGHISACLRGKWKAHKGWRFTWI